MFSKESDKADESSDFVEQQLINQAIAGSKEAFAKLYTLYYTKLFGYFYKYVQNPPQAEELTQQTFLQALKNIHTYKNKGLPFGPWIFKIANNLVINYHNREKKRFSPASIQSVLQLLELKDQSNDNLHQGLVQQELMSHLQQAINKLTPAQRAVIQLKVETDWEMSNKKIGKKLGKTEGAIKSSYNDALKRLKKLLEGSNYIG